MHTLVHMDPSHCPPLNEVKVVGMVWEMGAWVRTILVASSVSKCCVMLGPRVFPQLHDHSCVRPLIHLLQWRLPTCMAHKFLRAFLKKKNNGKHLICFDTFLNLPEVSLSNKDLGGVQRPNKNGYK